MPITNKYIIMSVCRLEISLWSTMVCVWVCVENDAGWSMENGAGWRMRLENGALWRTELGDKLSLGKSTIVYEQSHNRRKECGSRSYVRSYESVHAPFFRISQIHPFFGEKKPSVTPDFLAMKHVAMCEERTYVWRMVVSYNPFHLSPSTLQWRHWHRLTYQLER